MKIGNVNIENKIILAPLAGYTNRSYRGIAKEMGAGLVFTEMVSAKGLVYENDKTYDYIISNQKERPIAVQLFGGEINDLVKATTIVCNSGYADIIDINMGCPVKKVLKQGAGSFLLQDPHKVYEMVKAVVEVSTLPVSVKIRAGWDHEHINCTEVAMAIEKAGAKMITIHGRTKTDLYGGHVNLDYIKMVKDCVKIPVVGNGDIKSIQDAITMLEYTGCDAIMVGRSTLGNPWIIKELSNYFNGVTAISTVTLSERVTMIKRHYYDLKKIKCEKLALLEMRTLAVWYLKSVAFSKNIKLKIVKCESEKEFMDLMDSIEKSK